MKEIVKTRSWYDGWFYALFIDHKNSGLRRRIVNLIEPNKTVIDIGCGTGGLVLQLAPKCREVVGVDISERMIRISDKRKNKIHTPNVKFYPINAAQISKNLSGQFDYAIFSFFLHEITPEMREIVIQEILKIAKRAVFFDYISPLPNNFLGYTIHLIEFLAGRKHYRNFKDFINGSGLKPYFDQEQWTLEYHHINRQKIFQTVMVKNNNITARTYPR